MCKAFCGLGKDLRGVVMSWNKAAETTFGFAADEIVGRPIRHGYGHG
jgi:PAS domain S-box-containing protein